MESSSLAGLYLDKESSDLDLYIKGTDPKVVLPAHKFVLRRASEVFRAMLEEGKFKEGSSREIEIEVNGDITVCLLFLKYLYTKELAYINLEAYISLIQISDLYDVKQLTQLCETRITQTVTPITVCKTFVALENVASQELLEYLKNLMLQTAFLIFPKDLHCILSEGSLTYLLSSDQLNVLNEEQALEALWRWNHVTTALEIRAVEPISEFLPLIRWSLIPNVKKTSPWFSLWQTHKLDKWEVDGTTSETGHRMPVKFQSLSNFSNVWCLSGKWQDVTCTEEDKELKIISFQPDRDILLVGLTFQVIYSKKPKLSECSYQLFVNHEDVTNIMSYKGTLLSSWSGRKRHDVEDETGMLFYTVFMPFKSFLYDITVDFHKPIPVWCKSFNNVTLTTNHSLRMENFCLKETPKDTSSEEMCFTLNGNYNGVRQLYYFLL